MSFLKEIQAKSLAEALYKNREPHDLMRELKDNPTEERATSRCKAFYRSWGLTFEEWREQIKLALNAKLEGIC